MKSFLLMTIFLVIIGSIYFHNTKDDLETAAKDRDLKPPVKLYGSVDILASRKNFKLMKLVCSFCAILYFGFLLSLAFGGLYADVLDGSDYFGLLLTGFVSVFFLPIFGFFGFQFRQISQAVKSKRLIIRIDSNGFACRSKLAGPLGEHLWEDVKAFYPVTQPNGVTASLVIEFKPESFARPSIRYSTQNIRVNIVKLVEYFEGYSGLKSGALEKKF